MISSALIIRKGELNLSSTLSASDLSTFFSLEIDYRHFDAVSLLLIVHPIH